MPLSKKKDWNFVLWIFGRFGDNVRTTADARIGGLITKKVNKYVTLGGGYLYRYSNPTFRRGRYESRYLGLATFTVPLDKKWTVINRNLVQYEDRYSRPDATVLRNRAWVKREVTVAKKKIEPFVSLETFYDFRLKDFARFRTQAGISHKFNKLILGIAFLFVLSTVSLAQMVTSFDITEKKVIEAQKAWCAALIQINETKEKGDD